MLYYCRIYKIFSGLGCIYSMNIEYLRYFIAACELGSIQCASRQLFVSAQGIGKGIQRLEDSLGVKLLERTQLGVVPTDFGKAYYEQAKIVERELSKLDALANEYKMKKKRRIRIGTLGKQKFFYGVNACVEAYMKEYPDTSLELSSEIFSSSAELFDSIRSGRIDIGWMFHWQEYEDLSYYYISDYSPLLLLISADNPIAGKEHVTWDELSTLRYVTAGESDPFSGLMRRLSLDHGFEPDIALYTTENNVIASMVDNNAAAILLRKNYYKAIMQFCRNAAVIPVEPKIEIANSLIVSKRQKKNPDTMDFLEYMVKYLRDTMGLGATYE